jgi:hypothetical protein
MSSRWLPDILRGDRGRPGISSYAQLIAYFLANWAVTDWYVDSSIGDDSASGTSWGTALASPDELSRRLAVALPVDHTVTVHIGSGHSGGTLALSYIATAAGCPFVLVGTPSSVSAGGVSTYTDAIPLSNQGAHLVASGVPDWTSLVGSMVTITSGASVGAVAWIGKVNPNDGAGVPTNVATARTSKFAGVPSGAGFIPTNKVPAASSGISVSTLPVITHCAIRQCGLQPPSGAGFYADRGFSISFLAIQNLYIDAATPGIADSCLIGQVSSGALVQGTPITVVRSRFDGGAVSYLPLYRVTSWFSLFQRPGLVGVTLQEGAYLGYCLCQGTQLAAVDSAVYSTGVFDVAANDASLIAQFGSRVASYTSLYGRDNARCGYRATKGTSLYAATGCSILGASGAVYLDGSAVAIPTWAGASLWLDGARSGEAILIVPSAPGGGHDALTTSYVDVTVPFVLSTQRIAATLKTPAGTVGFPSAVYLNSTTIRLISTSALDTSVLTWSILAVGNSSLIRD